MEVSYHDDNEPSDLFNVEQFLSDCITDGYSGRAELLKVSS
jgi:hypothetical protein